VSLTEFTEGTVYIDAQTGAVTYNLGLYDPTNGMACGYYQNSLNWTGWSVLEINTNRVRTDPQGMEGTRLMYAAGYLEGLLTAK